MDQEQLKFKMSDVEKFKSAVEKIRNILRSCAVTGMDSLRHICLYMLGPYLTLDKINELGIPEEFAWENRNNLIQGDEDVSLEKFEQNLIPHFDRLFGTQKFTFEVKSGTKHKEILEILDDINMKNVDLHMDILGFIYEQHLKTGSSSSRDLGQFFTDRFICEYIVKLCNPKLKKNGIPESVCDPTMGTGGFLTAYLKHFKNVDWSVHQTQVHGVDHDSKVAGICRLNMFVESKGQLFKHLHTADSLHGGLDPTTYDIILANMPFGLKGLKYADVHPSIKKIGINGTKSEPLFLQLMMVSLNKGGRCAVVVPDGMLVNNSKVHNSTRKYLLENFELKRVIKMKGKFFMNTGIQPSILFFENSGNQTEQVEFWDVERDDKGNFTENVVLTVNVDKLDENYSLDMRKYKETVIKVYNDEVELMKLGDILKDCSVKNPIPTTKCDNGEYKVFSSSVDVFHHSEAEFKNGEYLIQGSRGTISGATHYCNTPFSVCNNVFVLTSNNDKVLLKYVYYYLKISKVTDSVAPISVIPMLTKTIFNDIKIPIPSLEFQEEIVENLDTVHESKQNALLMIENLKKQMNSIIQTVHYKDCLSASLNNIVEHDNGKPISGEEKEVGGQYLVMGGGMNYNGTYVNYNREGETISISKSGASAGFVKYHNSKYWAGDCFTITPLKDKNVLIKYIYYYLKNNQQLITSKTSGSTIPHCKWTDIRGISIPVPSIDYQKSIIDRLDKLQEQIDCLQEIEKQTDNNAKFMLEGYLEQ